MSRSEEIQKAFGENEGAILKELTLLATRVAKRTQLPAFVEPCDVAQEVLIRLIESLRNGKFRGNSSLKTYAYRITANVCLEWNRELRKLESANVDPDATSSNRPNGEEFLLDKERRFVMFRVLRRLHEKCRAVFRLMYSDGLDYSAIAQLHGVETVTIRARVSSCRKKARELAAKFSQ